MNETKPCALWDPWQAFSSIKASAKHVTGLDGARHLIARSRKIRNRWRGDFAAMKTAEKDHDQENSMPETVRSSFPIPPPAEMPSLSATA